MPRKVPFVLVMMVVLGVGSAFAADPREALIDLLASDQIERIDFVATTFEGAMSSVERVAEQVIVRGSEVFANPEETGAVCADVIAALNSFRPRTEGYVFNSELTFVILDTDDADALAELIVTAAQIVDADPAARITAKSATENLLRGVVLDVEAGVPPVVQLLEHVQSVVELPAAERAKFLR